MSAQLTTSLNTTKLRRDTRWWTVRSVGMAVFGLVLTGAFLALTVPGLGRYSLVSGDDSWVMSASYKLATTGVFGSDLYAGFHGAEQHYFIALPVYHLLQALSFVLFGAGIVAARLVSLGSAVIVLWATMWLTLRWYGTAASVVSGLLLLLLRVNLVSLWPGLPLLAVGRGGRYDMTGVAFVWLTVVFLDLAIQDREWRRPWPAYAAGLCAGLATLTQFFGAFTIPIVAVVLAWRGGRRTTTAAVAARIAAGWTVVVVPYLSYVATYWSDFRGQSALKAGRTDLLDAGFYLNNLRDETARYQHLVDPDLILGSGASNWTFVVTIWPILAWLAWRSRRLGRNGDRLLLTTLIVCGAGLALFESTKAPLYAIVLWPGCCIAVAAAIASGLSWMRRAVQGGRNSARRPLVAVAVVVALLVVADGVDAYREDRQRARTVSDYAEVARQLDAALPAQAGVIGHERWWWGLHEREYLALNVLRLEWERDAGSAGTQPSFAAQFNATGARALIIDDNARSEMARYPAELRRQIEAFIATQVEQTTVIVDPSYGQFEVYLRP